MERPRTEIWFRNPFLYMEQLRDIGAFSVTWDQGFITKRRLDSWAYTQRFFGQAHWQTLTINDYFAHLQNWESRDIKAVWPVWSADGTESLSNLVRHCMKPYSESRSLTNGRVEPDKRPVNGQKHVVIITNLPNYTRLENRAFYSDLVEIQNDFPEVTIMPHGSYSSSLVFGSNFRMADWDPRTDALKGKIALPTGRVIQPEVLGNGNNFWAHLLGYSLSDLKIAGKRCEYNIKSALWAATYYQKLNKFGIKKGGIGDVRLEAYIKENNYIFTKRLAAKPGDRIVCDDCSLWLHCKYFREEAVCAVPKTDMSKVAELFGTRNSRDIVNGLGKLLEVQTERAQRALDQEAIANEGVDPALNKLMDTIFNQGSRLLEIVDPAYRKSATTKVDVNVLGNKGTALQITNIEDAQRQLASQAITLLEQRGIARSDMTEEMLSEAVAFIIQSNTVVGEIES